MYKSIITNGTQHKEFKRCLDKRCLDKKAIIMALLLWLPLCINAQDDSTKALTIDASYTGDIMGNVRGGMKRGTTYVGWAEASVDANLEKLGLWRGGEAYVDVVWSHGGMPSAHYVGDIQGVNLNETGNYFFLNGAWISQQLGPVNLKGGIIDFPNEYGDVPALGNFLTGTYQCNNIVLLNGNPPVSSTAGLGFNLAWDINSHLTWQVGLFDGRVRALDDDNPLNLKHSLANGSIIISQLGWHNSLNTFQIGAFRNTCLKGWGAYAAGQARVYTFGQKSIDAFATFGIIPEVSDVMTRNITAGVNINGLLLNSHDDVLGVGVTTSKLYGESWETNIEANYNIPFLDHFYIQPDIEYIINPGATHELKNSIMTNFRFGIYL